MKMITSWVSKLQPALVIALIVGLSMDTWGQATFDRDDRMNELITDLNKSPEFGKYPDMQIAFSGILNGLHQNDSNQMWNSWMDLIQKSYSVNHELSPRFRNQLNEMTVDLIGIGFEMDRANRPNGEELGNLKKLILEKSLDNPFSQGSLAITTALESAFSGPTGDGWTVSINAPLNRNGSVNLEHPLTPHENRKIRAQFESTSKGLARILSWSEPSAHGAKILSYLAGRLVQVLLFPPKNSNRFNRDSFLDISSAWGVNFSADLAIDLLQYQPPRARDQFVSSTDIPTISLDLPKDPVALATDQKKLIQILSKECLFLMEAALNRDSSLTPYGVKNALIMMAFKIELVASIVKRHSKNLARSGVNRFGWAAEASPEVLVLIDQFQSLLLNASPSNFSRDSQSKILRTFWDELAPILYHSENQELVLKVEGLVSKSLDSKNEETRGAAFDFFFREYQTASSGLQNRISLLLNYENKSDGVIDDQVNTMGNLIFRIKTAQKAGAPLPFGTAALTDWCQVLLRSSEFNRQMWGLELARDAKLVDPRIINLIKKLDLKKAKTYNLDPRQIVQNLEPQTILHAVRCEFIFN